MRKLLLPLIFRLLCDCLTVEIEVRAAVVHPNHRHLVGGEVEEGGHHRRQVDVDERIVHRTQNGQSGADFHRFQKSHPAVGPHRHTQAGQFVFINLCAIFHRAQQDTDFSRAHRSHLTVVVDQKALVEHLFDLPGSIPCLCHRVGKLLASVFHQMHLGVRLQMLGVDRRWGERLAVVVVDLPHLAAHQGIKQVVDGIGNLAAGAEIVGQDDARRIVLPVVIMVGTALVNKNFRHRLTKSVDALLDISDHKKVIRA